MWGAHGPEPRLVRGPDFASGSPRRPVQSLICETRHARSIHGEPVKAGDALTAAPRELNAVMLARVKREEQSWQRQQKRERARMS